MRSCLAFLLIVPLAACGDGPDVDFGGADLGDDRFAIHSEDGAVRMGLTDDFVYFALSDSLLAKARDEMADTAPRSEGIRGAFSGMVRSGVDRALSFRASFPVQDIRDIRWEDGRMHVEFEDGRTGFGEEFQVNDGPVEDAFTEEDVRAFATEFRRAKARYRGG